MSEHPWIQCDVDVHRTDTARVSEALFAHGASGVQEEHRPGEQPRMHQVWDAGPPPRKTERVLLRAWFQQPDRDGINQSVAPNQTTWSDLPDTDYLAQFQAQFPPLRISDRLTIAAPWDAPDDALIIEPGQGFGSGQHPSTLASLRAVDGLADSIHTVLDVGCGSGILALAAAKFGCTVRGIDHEAPAIQNAIDNAALNGLTADFSTTPVQLVEDGAELVCANMHAEVLLTLHCDLIRLTQDHLVLAGILDNREKKVRKAFDPELTLVGRVTDGEWVALHYRRTCP